MLYYSSLTTHFNFLFFNKAKLGYLNNCKTTHKVIKNKKITTYYTEQKS